jgi:hypothetical protein
LMASAARRALMAPSLRWSLWQVRRMVMASWTTSWSGFARQRVAGGPILTLPMGR